MTTPQLLLRHKTHVQRLFYVLILFATVSGFSAGQAAMMDGIDIQQRGGETYVYLHTNETIEHESRVENRHSISVMLEDVSVFGGQLPIHYEQAPGIKNVMVEHTGPRQIKLSLEGKHLKAPIIGFRESSVVPVNTDSPVVASNFLAIASSGQAAASAVMPTALESSVMQGAMPQRSALANASYNDALLLELSEYYIGLITWAKEHRFLLGMVLLGGLSTLFVLNFVGKLLFARLERTPAPSQMNTEEARALQMQGISFSPPVFQPSGVSHPVAPQPASPNEHRLNRIREKMKQQGYAITPEAPVAIEANRPSPSDLNLKVKEAIARRKSQQYQRPGVSPVAPRPVATFNQSIVAQPTQAGVTPPLAGNGFLHAMAEYMDTPSKEHIARAIQQSKLKY
jgi:hypothetical protein